MVRHRFKMPWKYPSMGIKKAVWSGGLEYRDKVLTRNVEKQK